MALCATVSHEQSSFSAISPISFIVDTFSVGIQQYDDDTQLYVSLAKNFYTHALCHVSPALMESMATTLGAMFFIFSFYSPQMVVTIYNKIHNENDLTKKKEKKQKTKQMACTCLNW